MYFFQIAAVRESIFPPTLSLSSGIELSQFTSTAYVVSIVWEKKNAKCDRRNENSKGAV